MGYGVMSGLKKAFTSSLTQKQTNGLSLYGTLKSAVLPLFLTNNPLPGGSPWGSLTARHSNPYKDAPYTGVIRNYDFTISRGLIAPDGYQTAALLVNGQFPGPTIEANWGDKIVVRVHNNISGPEEGTSLHWHGFLQTGTIHEDGVPGVTQCPISPGKDYTYELNAELYGTSWYHSHYSAQYSSGIVGPIVIHGPTDPVTYDIDIGPVMLSDWSHKPYFQTVEEALSPGGNPAVMSDNNLINGKNNFDCSTLPSTDKTPCDSRAGISVFRFQSGKTHRLRIINTSSEAVQRFSIDRHNMTVFAYDYVPIEPYNTAVITLGVGQRADVLVKADAGPATSSFWIRSNITSCSLTKQPYAVAALFYEGADTSMTPASTAWNIPDPGTCINDDLSLTKPLFVMPLPPKPAVVRTMDIGVGVNATGSVVWSFGGVSARSNYNHPALFESIRGNTSLPTQWNVIELGNNATVRIIVNNNSPASHPMHLHGHNFYILHEGEGSWDGTTIVRPENPMRRDVELVRAHGHVVIQFDVNPGVWAWHCHIAWHASGGFFSVLVVGQDQVRKMRVPDTSRQTCKEWDRWSSRNVVEQIDSGN